MPALKYYILLGYSHKKGTRRAYTGACPNVLPIFFKKEGKMGKYGRKEGKMDEKR